MYLEKLYLFVQRISYIQDCDLDIGARSQNALNLELSHPYASLAGIKPIDQKLSQNFTYLSPSVTLKIRPRSPKANQLLSLSQ